MKIIDKQILGFGLGSTVGSIYLVSIGYNVEYVGLGLSITMLMIYLFVKSRFYRQYQKNLEKSVKYNREELKID